MESKTGHSAAVEGPSVCDEVRQRRGISGGEKHVRDTTCVAFLVNTALLVLSLTLAIVGVGGVLRFIDGVPLFELKNYARDYVDQFNLIRSSMFDEQLGSGARSPICTWSVPSRGSSRPRRRIPTALGSTVKGPQALRQATFSPSATCLRMAPMSAMTSCGPPISRTWSASPSPTPPREAGVPTKLSCAPRP